MHFLRLLTHEVTEFAKTLKTPSACPSNAVLEHKLAAASQLYNNIGFDELGRLLGINELEMDEYAAAMIEQGQLNGGLIIPLDSSILRQDLVGRRVR
jgi:hypothetical protein